MAHDTAMLKLDRPAQIKSKVNLACLPGSSGSVSEGKRCWITGMWQSRYQLQMNVVKRFIIAKGY